MANMKELLGEDLFKQVSEKLGDKVRIDVVSDGEWIPKDKFSGVNTEKNSYKEQVATLNGELSKLQLQLKDNQAASDTVETLKKTIADKESELAKVRKTNSITLEAMKYNPNDINDILPHIKHENIVVTEEGTISGLSEQLKTLTESKPYLFKQQTAPSGTGGSVGGGAKPPTGTQSNSASTFVDVIKSQSRRNK